jgi:hypothetical protein
MGYTQGLTVREIRKILFDTDMIASINEQNMSNKEARDYLYAKNDQEQVLITFEKNDCLLIWGV